MNFINKKLKPKAPFNNQFTFKFLSFTHYTYFS